MAIQNEMYKAIVKEIESTIDTNKEKVIVDIDKAKEVAAMLTELSISNSDAESLTNQYIANIKNICKP